MLWYADMVDELESNKIYVLIISGLTGALQKNFRFLAIPMAHPFLAKRRTALPDAAIVFE
jgi:hypothetical protein